MKAPTAIQNTSADVPRGNAASAEDVMRVSVIEPKRWWVGALLTIATMVALELYDRWDVGAQLASVLIFAVVLSAYLGGRRSGLVSTALVFGYALVEWRIVPNWAGSPAPDRARLILLSIVTPGAALVVGYLREQADRAFQALRDDIARRKDAEAALTAVNEQLDSVMKFSPDLICTLDIDGRFLLVSESCSSILGYTPGEMIGRSYLNFLHPDDRDATAAAQVAVRERRKLTDFENRLLHKDGRVVTLVWSNTWDDRTLTTYAVGRDVTHLREAEAARLRDQQTIATLQELLCVCAWCNKIRNEAGGWDTLEQYVERRSSAHVSHAMCPTCLEQKYPGA